MKKLKIRGKDIKKLGLKDDSQISLAINLIAKNFKRYQKVEALEKLEKLINNPGNYVNDEAFGIIAQSILKPKSKKEKARVKEGLIKEHPGYYKIYGRQGIEEGAISQMDTAMSLPVSVKGALMADAHQGYGLPIGGVLATVNAIIPYAVGMDIGCRMCMSIYPLSDKFMDENKQKLKDVLIYNTRFGRAEFNDIKENQIVERNEFKEIKLLKSLKDKAFRQLGTSGGGNHFVDFGYIETAENDYLNIAPGKYFAILSHSGSRGLGAEIARHYTRIAKEKCGLPKGAINLAWLNLDEDEGIEYWNAMQLAGDYSSENHRIIHQKLAKALGEKPMTIIENHHNFAWKEKLNKNEEIIIHRKGATPADKGVLGIIPGSMASPAFIVAGKGAPESLNSASHGAGRLLSRSQAKSSITLKSLKQLMQKKCIDLIGGDTDEAPSAYKDILKIMEYQKDLVEIVATFYPKMVRMDGEINI